MSKKANPAIIGMFVVGAVVLAFAGLIIFGAGTFFSDKQQFILYFNGTLQGLGVGAPVTFKGISVGKVTEIRVLVDRDNLSFRVPVFIEIDLSKFKPADMQDTQRIIIPGKRREFLSMLVEQGLRAQLQVQSLVTGQLLIALDFHPDTPIQRHGPDSEVQELPTIPSSIEVLAKKVEELPLEDLVNGALRAIEGIDRLVNNPNIGGNLEALQTTQLELQKLMQNINSRVEPVADELSKATEAITAAANQAAESLETMNGLVAEDSKLRYELYTALEELALAARSMRAMADTIQQNPESLLYGRGSAGGK